MKTIPSTSRSKHPFKEIGYAYPSSTMATLFCKPREGCYVIQTHTHDVGPFDTWDAAHAYAETLPACPYSELSDPRPELPTPAR